jgi:hypothetical protein
MVRFVADRLEMGFADWSLPHGTREVDIVAQTRWE